MKKTYNTPEVKVVEIENQTIMEGSETTPTTNNSVGNCTQLEEAFRNTLWGDD